MAGQEGKMDILFEVLCFSWEGPALPESFEKGGLSFHVENVNVLEEFTPVSPSQVDAVVYRGSSKELKRPEMMKYRSIYSKTPLRIWVQKRCTDFDVDLILSECFQVVSCESEVQKLCKLFFSQLTAFLTKLLAKLDLNDSKTVELEDLTVYAEQLGVQLTPQDVEEFLREHEDEGDAFLTARGIMKWIKKGKPASPVGEIILKVIEAKRLLNGFTIDIKRVFLEQIAINRKLEGDFELLIGELGPEQINSKLELHAWSRDLYPGVHPLDELQLSSIERSSFIALTLPIQAGRSTSQVEDFMRNTVFRLDLLLRGAQDDDMDMALDFDYRITDDSATLYLICDLLSLLAADKSMKHDFSALFSVLQSSLSYEAHFAYESMSGVKDCLEKRDSGLLDMLGQGIKCSTRYSVDSGIKDTAISFPLRPWAGLTSFIYKQMHAHLHFSNFNELPEGLKESLREATPKELKTAEDLINMIGSIFNHEAREKAIEKYIELMTRSFAELFDVENIEINAGLWNLIAKAKIKLRGLDALFRIDLSEVRRKALEAKRAAEIGESQDSQSENLDPQTENPSKYERRICDSGCKMSKEYCSSKRSDSSTPIRRSSSGHSECKVLVPDVRRTPSERSASSEGSAFSSEIPRKQSISDEYRVDVPSEVSDERLPFREARVRGNPDDHSGSEEEDIVLE